MTLSQKQIIQRRYKNLTPEYAKTIIKEFREQWPEVAKYYKIIKRQPKNNKIFVVSRYSDYYIVGIFTTKNKAEEYIKEVCKNNDCFLERNFDIEECNINEGCI